jgi:hypothetical protein
MYLLHERYDLKKRGRARQLCPVLSLGSSATCWPCRSRRPRERYVFKNEAEPGSSAPFVVGSSAPCWPCRSCRPRLHAFVSLVSMPSFPSSPRPRLPRLHVLDHLHHPRLSSSSVVLVANGRYGFRLVVRVVDGQYGLSMGLLVVAGSSFGATRRRWAALSSSSLSLGHIIGAGHMKTLPNSSVERQASGEGRAVAWAGFCFRLALFVVLGSSPCLLVVCRGRDRCGWVSSSLGSPRSLSVVTWSPCRACHVLSVVRIERDC